MDNLYKRKVYESMRKKKAAASKKRPQLGLSNRLLDDSDEESCASTTSISESEYENDDSSGTERTPDSVDEKSSSDDDGSESSGKQSDSQSRRKRPSFPDSSSDSDSDIEPKPKKKKGPTPRKRIIVSGTASDSDAENSTSKEKRVAETKETIAKRKQEAKETIAKRKQRKDTLLALSQKMKSRVSKRRSRQKNSGEEDDAKEEAEADVGSDKADNDDGEEDDGGDDGGEDREDRGLAAIPSSRSEEIRTSDSLRDFIVEDEENDDDELEEKDVFSPIQFAFGGNPEVHFQLVVKALLINVLDETFLKSLYSGERTKRYAKQMKMSLYHFDEKTVLPRLENLHTRSRWTERYKARVECYPKVRLLKLGVNDQTCEACTLPRPSSFTVKLWGQQYDNNTLQEDHFMPNDTQTFSVGSVCANRTEVYHLLKHFKYHLFQHCRTVLEEEKTGGTEKEAVKDTVNRVFIKLQEGGWISEQFEKFQDHLNNADLFQTEDLD